MQNSDFGQSNAHTAPESGSATARTDRMRKYLLSNEAIQADLSSESPQWILSAYGPGMRTPTQLFGGPDRELSFEEMRLRFHDARALGNPALAVI